jgi:hypothetical protein
LDNVCQIKATPRFVLILSALAVALASAALVGPSAAAEPIADRDAICRVPFEKLKDPKTGEYFPLSSAINENAKLPDSVRQRYIVGDFNSTDESGNCRGVKEWHMFIAFSGVSPECHLARAYCAVSNSRPSVAIESHIRGIPSKRCASHIQFGRLVHNLWFGLSTSLFIMLGVLSHFLPSARLLLEFALGAIVTHKPCGSGTKAGMYPKLFSSGHLEPLSQLNRQRGESVPRKLVNGLI